MSDDILSYGPGGTAHFDAAAAQRLYAREMEEWRRASTQGPAGPVVPGNEREFRASMLDLERLGMRADADPRIATPRAIVHPAANVPGGIPGLQGLEDMPNQVSSPGERYWEAWAGQKAVHPSRAVSKTPLPAECEKFRPLIEECFGPMIRKLSSGKMFVQPMGWLEPPVTAISVDIFTNALGVSVPGAYPGPGDCVDVLTISASDRMIFVLDRFGNELEDHLAFGDVRMSMSRNKTPIRSYGNFDVQLGRFVRPTKLGSPILLKHKDEFRFKAQSLSATTHKVFARIQGWAFATHSIVGDGTYNEFQVQ